MSAQDDMLQPLVDHTLALVRAHPSDVPLNRYLERIDGIRERYEDVVHRRINLATYPERVCLSLGYTCAFIDRVHPAAEDLAVWSRAHRVLGGVP